MKSNIGLVFVVNSEKAFGRFVKEFAGEEEMTIVLLKGGHTRGIRGQTLWVPGCKYTWGDFGDHCGGIPSWCPIWGGRPVLGSSHRAESIPMVPLDFFQDSKDLFSKN